MLEFYAVPTSPATYELIRKVFELLGWNVDNILFIEGLEALDMNRLLELTVEQNDGCQRNEGVDCPFHDWTPIDERREYGIEDVDIPKNRKQFKNNKGDYTARAFEAAFEHIFDSIIDKDLQVAARELWGKMKPTVKKFDYAISNPPYQIKTGGRNGWFYTDFIYFGKLISLNSTMVTPSTFLNTFDTTQGVDINLRKDKGLKFVALYKTKELFEDVGVNEISISTFVNNFDNMGEYIEEKDGIISVKKPVLQKSDLHPDVLKILLTRINKTHHGVGDIISPRDPWKSEEFSKQNKEKYKAIFKEKNVTAVHASKVLKPNEISDHRYLASYFDTEQEAFNFLEYQKTKFYQKLVTENTTSHAGSAAIHNIVPDLIDYSHKNDIFKKDVELKEDNVFFGLSLNERLYKYFDLTPEEIVYIEQ